MSDVPDYFNSHQTNTRSLSGLPLNTTPMSLEHKPRTPAATRISPYLNRVSPTAAAFGSSYSSSVRRTPNRFYPGGATSPLTTPSSLREVYTDSNQVYGTSGGGSNTGNLFVSQGNNSQEGLSQAPYTSSKRDSYNSIQGTSPTLYSNKLGAMQRRESSSSPTSMYDRNEKYTVRANGFKMVRMNTSMFDADER